MYSHTQTGWMTLAALLGAVVAIGAAAEAEPEAKIPLMLTMAFLALMLPLFGWLTVTVDEEAVTARFGVGLIRRRIKIKDILSAAPVRNKWYNGWGVRMLDTGWMYNVSGLDAVEIEYQGGKFRIGTDEPEELVRALRRGMELGGRLPISPSA
jgi:hypothetical protein